MVFTSEHRRFIIESYFRNSAFNNQDFFLTGIRVEFVVRFCLDGNSCAGLQGLCPSPGIKYYADGNSCASVPVVMNCHIDNKEWVISRRSLF
jgi:hypothetical protein